MPELVCLVQNLASEKRRLQSEVAQLERELVAREGQLAGQAGELTALQEAQRDANAQMNQYVMDLQVSVWICHCHRDSATADLRLRNVHSQIW